MNKFKIIHKIDGLYITIAVTPILTLTY